MTHKDYILIANAINAARLRVASDPVAVDALEIAADELAFLLRNDNARFDRERFISATRTGVVQ